MKVSGIILFAQIVAQQSKHSRLSMNLTYMYTLIDKANTSLECDTDSVYSYFERFKERYIKRTIRFSRF